MYVPHVFNYAPLYKFSACNVLLLIFLFIISKNLFLLFSIIRKSINSISCKPFHVNLPHMLTLNNSFSSCSIHRLSMVLVWILSTMTVSQSMRKWLQSRPSWFVDTERETKDIWNNSCESNYIFNVTIFVYNALLHQK